MEQNVKADVEVSTDDMERVSKEYESRVAGIEVNVDSIMYILQYAMEVCETIKAPGESKRTMATNLISKSIRDAPMPTPTRVLLTEMVNDGLVGHIMDIVIAASKGKVHVQAKLKVGEILCAALAPVAFQLCPCTKD